MIRSRANSPARLGLVVFVAVLQGCWISQFARADGQYGAVAFANSGAPQAQADFLEGLALLHDFEYPLASAAFRRAQAADPGFAMAYWGEAMTFNHPIWMQQNLAGARAALEKLAPSPAERRLKAKTERERAYLDAVETLYSDGSKLQRDLAYAAAMGKVHEQFPDDVDASAFYGMAILGTAHAGRDTDIYMRAAAVLEEAWPGHREHPGLVHYLIHCYDDPAHAPLGLRPARIYGRLAPDAPHALHMTSHIFLALGMWPETVEANVAATRAVNARREAMGRKPIHWGHYSTWLAYAYLQLGKANDAERLLKACRADVEMAADPSGETALDPDESISGSFANMRLRYLLDTGDWDGEAARSSAPKNLGARGRLDFVFADTLIQIGLGHKDQAGTLLRELDSAGRKLAEVATKEGNADPTERVRPEILLLEARGLVSELERDFAAAEKLLSQATSLEDTLPIAFGPPSVDKPTHELLGQFLLRHDKAKEARAQFEKALALTPGRRVTLEGLRATAAVAVFSSASLTQDKEPFVRALPENDPICGLPGRH